MTSETSNFINDTSSDFEIGKIVFQKFEILAFISEGANGRVYKARDILRDAVVALKVLLSATSDDKSLMRFQSEAKAISKMKHPNIATVYDFGLVEGVPYLSMEYVKGESLESILETQGSLPLVLALAVFIQICDALVHAHKNGIVHRDIKPANIILSNVEDGSCRVTVLDFGVAKNIDISLSQQHLITQAGNIVGSPLYMSPEQGRGELVTEQSDVYSLGCVMWRCLSGEPPFMGETVVQTIWHQINTEPGELVSNNSDLALPSKLTEIVCTSLSKVPSERPDLESNVLPALARLLEDALNESSQQKELNEAADEDTTGGASRKARNKKLFGAFAIALFVFPLLLFSIGSILNHQPSPPLPPSTPPFNESARLLFDSETTKANELMESPNDDKLELSLRFNCSDHNLQKISHRKSLESLEASDSPLSDAAFVHLSKLSNLKRLDLNRTVVKTLKNIDKLTNLEELDLQNTLVTDVSLLNLKPLKKLRELELTTDRITDRGVSNLVGMNSLRVLRLNDTLITPAVSKQITQLRLSLVDLKKTKVTEETIREIAKMPSMEEIDCRECSAISPARIKAFRQDFPRIHFAPEKSVMLSLMSEANKANSEGKYSKVLSKYQDGLKLAECRFGSNSVDAAKFHQLIGDVALKLKRPALATQSYEQALQIFQKSNDTVSALVCLDKLTAMFAVTNRSKATDCASRALKFSEKINGEISLDVANRTLTLGDYYREASSLAKASSAYKKSYAITSKLCGPQSKELACVMIRTGEMHRLAGDLDSAKSVLAKARSILTKSPVSQTDQQNAGTASVGMAEINFRQKKFQQALKDNSKAIDFYTLAKTRPASICQAYQQRSAILSSLGETKAAQAAFEKSKKFRAQADALEPTPK